MFDKLFQVGVQNYSYLKCLFPSFLFFSFLFPPARACIINFAFVTQADWKPEAPERFRDIADLIKSVDTLTIDQPKKQGNHISKELAILHI